MEQTKYDTDKVITEFYPILKKKDCLAFFQEACLFLQKKLELDYCFIAQVLPLKNQTETIAMAHRNAIVENMTYNLEGTPCNLVFHEKVDYQIFEHDLIIQFPEDDLAKKMNISGYVGYALKDDKDKEIGIMVGLTETPLKNTALILSVFKELVPLIEKRLELYVQKLELNNNTRFFNQIETAFSLHGWEYNITHRYLNISPGWAKLLELERFNGLLPETYFNLIDTADQERLVNDFTDFLKQPEKYNNLIAYQYAIRSVKTKRLIKIQGRAELVNSVGGVKLLGVVREVTDFPDNDTFKLFQYNILNKKITDGLYWAKKINGKYLLIEVSDSLLKFTGFKKEELLGQDCFSFARMIETEDKEKVDRYWQKERSFQHFVYKLKLPVGKSYYVAHSNSFFEFNGEKYAVGTFANVNKEVMLSKIRDFFLEIAKIPLKKVYNPIKVFDEILIALSEFIEVDELKIEVKLFNKIHRFSIDKHSKSTQSAERTKFDIDFSNRNKIRVTSKNNRNYRYDIPLRIQGRQVGSIIVQNTSKLKNIDKEIIEYSARQISQIINVLYVQYELVEKERKFNDLVEQAFDIVGTLNLNGEFEFISPAVKDILGYEVEEVIGKKFMKFFHPVEIDDVMGVFMRRQTNQPIFTENTWKLRAKSGQTKIVDVRVKNRIENNQLTGFIFSASDISENYYRQLEQTTISRIFEISYKTQNIEAIIEPVFEFVNLYFKDITTQIVFTYKQTDEVIRVLKWNSHKRAIDIETLFYDNQKVEKKLFSIFKNTPLILPFIVDKEHIGSLMVENVFETKKDKVQFEFMLHKIFRILKIIYKNKQLKNELYQKLQLQTNLLDAIPDILFIIDATGMIRYLKTDNKTTLFHKEISYSGKNVYELYQPKFASKFMQVVHKVLKSKNKQHFEYYLKDEEKVKYYDSVFAPYTENEVIVLEREVTAKKEMEEKLITEVIAAQEKEKNRFAKDMHDGLGQILLAAKMNLTALDSVKNKLDDFENEVYDKTLNLLTQSVQEARNISHGLMSRALKEFGLEYAVNDLVKNINHQHLQIQFKSNLKSKRFNENFEIAVYRIVQEIFNNIIKHSKADKVEITIHFEGNNLYFKIVDNGIGFDLDKILKNGKGIGIQNIITRVNYLNGEIDIETAHRKGTKYLIKFNINQ